MSVVFFNDKKILFSPPYSDSWPCRYRFACGKLILPQQCSKIWNVRKFKRNLKFYRTSAAKSTFRTQNGTDSANFRYTENKKYRSYHVRNVFNRASESLLASALKYAFPHLIRNILLLLGMRDEQKICKLV